VHVAELGEGWSGVAMELGPTMAVGHATGRWSWNQAAVAAALGHGEARTEGCEGGKQNNGSGRSASVDDELGSKRVAVAVRALRSQQRRERE
jgi:hypothetical protein